MSRVRRGLRNFIESFRPLLPVSPGKPEGYFRDPLFDAGEGPVPARLNAEGDVCPGIGTVITGEGMAALIHEAKRMDFGR